MTKAKEIREIWNSVLKERELNEAKEHAAQAVKGRLRPEFSNCIEVLTKKAQQGLPRLSYTVHNVDSLWQAEELVAAFKEEGFYVVRTLDNTLDVAVLPV